MILSSKNLLVLNNTQLISEIKRTIKPLKLKLVKGGASDRFKFYLMGTGFIEGFNSYAILYENILNGYIESQIKENQSIV